MNTKLAYSSDRIVVRLMMTTATLTMAMMMMMIVEMKMIVVKIIIGIIPRSTSTMVGTEMPISRQINVDNLLLYYVSHVLMLEGIISIVSIRIERNSVSKKGGYQPLVQY